MRPRFAMTTIAIIAMAFACINVLAAAEAEYVTKERAAWKALAPTLPDGPTVHRLAKPLVSWSESSKAPAYSAATAAEPHFSDKALWPAFTGKEAYATETWPKTRTLVWAKPGTNGGKEVGGRDHALSILDPANWLEDGKPATELWDEDTDLVIPAAATPYSVSVQDCGKRQECRHITVGANATFQGGGDGVGRQIHGNVWIKSGGKLYAQGATTLVGGKNTFFRNDSRENPGCTQYFAFDRSGGSVEYLGMVTCADEFMLNSGTVIVGPDSILQPGRCCMPYVNKGATLALMDNAYFGSWANTWCTSDLTIKGGTLQGGLPDRPLTRSAVVGLSFKNHLQATKVAEGQLGIWFDCARVSSLLLQEGSVVRSFAAPNSQAALVLREAGYYTICSETGIARIFPWDGMYDWCREKWPDGWKNDQWFDQYPKGCDLLAFPGVTITNVHFSGFRTGGIMVTDAKTAASWKNVAIVPVAGAEGAPPAFSTTVVTTAKANGAY